MKKYKKIHKNKNKKGNFIYQIALPKSFVESMFDDDYDKELRVVVEYKDTRRKGKRIIISKDDSYDF